MTEEPFVGVDLGTTNSVIAVVGADGYPEVILNAEGRRTTPSVVQIGVGGAILVGEFAKQQAVVEKENTAHFFKRDMGTSARYQYSGRTWTPVDLSAEVLKKLKGDASARFSHDVRYAVITVPAYFQDPARVATRMAGEMAGLEVVQIINEPTAAALAYGLRQADSEELILVYDLGGGTFDITLARVTPDAVHVIGTDGNHNLGGKDWDDRLVQYVCDEFRRRHNIDPLDDPFTFQEILVRCEEAKQKLSVVKTAVVPLSCQGTTDRIEVSRDVFDSVTYDLLSQTEMLMNKVLEETGHDYSEVAGILMVGGSTRMKACRDLVRRLTGREPNTSVNPDECVALGAAIQASLYQRERAKSAGAGVRFRARVEDVMSHSMGMIAVSADGQRYINSVLIPKNTTIPCREVRPYLIRTGGTADTSISVYVTQGEGEDPANCVIVGKYVIKDISAAKEQTVLDIAYEYDASGVVQVSAIARVEGRPLEAEKQEDSGDISWIYRSPKEVVRVQHKSILAAVDLSGSMSGQPLLDAQAALRGFIANSDLANTSIGLMSFADKVNVDQSLTQNARLLDRAVGAWSIGPVGYGNSTDPFEEALNRLRDCSGMRYLVVLTDGVWAHCDAAERRARECHKAGVEVIAIGFGSAHHAFLERIANSRESALLVNSGDLVSAFGQIAQVLLEADIGHVGPAIGLRLKR